MTKICYILSYKSPQYVRTTTLVNALELIPEVELFQARNKSSGIKRYLETFFKFIKIRVKENPDVYVIGFRGHEIYWFIRLFALRKTFIFDEMMSPYDSLVNERKTLNRKNPLAKILYSLERSILKNTDYVITDTNLHVEFLSSNFKIQKEKIFAIPVGTDEKIFDIKNTKAKDFGNKFTVFFYATFLPLHGVDIVLKAAKEIKDLPIQIIIVGGKGTALEEFNRLKQQLKLENVKHYQWLEFEELPKYIKGADLCLGGPFGGTPQARRVVTGKTYQFLSMGKPTIIGKIDEDTGFVDGNNCFLVEQNDPTKLAEKIQQAYCSDLTNIGESGRNLFNKKYTAKEISKIIKFKLLDRIS